MNYKTPYILLFIIISIALVTWSINYLFLRDGFLYFQSYGNQLSRTSIEKVIDYSNKWQWLGYIILPIIILLKIFYTSIFLYMGVFFSDLIVKFTKLFNLVVIAHFIYVLSNLVKLIILIFFKEVSTLEDLQFTPLSIMELLDYETVDPLFIYPLSLLNIFELLYFLVLAWLLIGVINEANEERPVNFGKSLQLVTASYGSGLLLWVLVVMFITLNIS